MYDIFYVSKGEGNTNDWIEIKSRYPLAQRLANIKSYEEIRSKSFTKMFWVIWDDVSLNNSFSLTDYRATKWDEMYVHVFKNGEHYDGVCLFPKLLTISQREFDNRFFIEKKEIDILASTPIGYDKFNISTYEEYLKSKEESTTDMFWAVWPDIVIDKNFKFNYKVPTHNHNIVHVFKNGEHYDGVCLFPKNTIVTKREFFHRFFAEKKEIDILASTPKTYNVYSPTTYYEYTQILDEMFWLVWPEVEILDKSALNLYFSHHNTYDRRETHVFKNLCNDTETYLSGVLLCSKFKPLSEDEFKKQYAADKKEHATVISRYRYNQYVVSTYNEYKQILETETQPLFWCIWPEITVLDNTIFDLYFDPNDGKYDHDRTENHSFKHQFNDTEIYTNSVVLLSTSKPVSQREFNHRFLINKKEHDKLVSKHRVYDVVFISYNEPNADENYKKLLVKCPRAKRVHGVTGIHQAHIEAAKLCNTDMIWIVDGDAEVSDTFNFDLVMLSYDIDCVHVWRSQNPINDLEYGNGGVKLLPRKLTLEVNINSSDMTTSISKKFKAMDSVSNVTKFNTDEFATWRSAFRECCKLASRVIERQYEEETQARLDVWCSTGSDRPFGEYAIKGALMGRAYGEKNKNNPEALIKINDFNWLEEQFRGI